MYSRKVHSTGMSHVCVSQPDKGILFLLLLIPLLSLLLFLLLPIPSPSPSSPLPPLSPFLFSPGKSLMPSLFTKFSFGVMRILLHTADSFMFLRLTKLLCYSFSFFHALYLNLSFLMCPNSCSESYSEVWTQTARNSAYNLSLTAEILDNILVSICCNGIYSLSLINSLLLG